MRTIEEQCRNAKEAARSIALLSTIKKNKILENMAAAILAHRDAILAANAQDVAKSPKDDRLLLNEKRLQDISDGLVAISKLADPIGEVMTEWTRPNGLNIKKIRVPLGVVGMIYEARPNVTADAVALALKTGNAVVLRGSSSAYQTNKAILEAMLTAVENRNAFQLLEDTSREGVETLVRMNKYLDVIIPRGGASLIQNVVNNATVPTIETGVGNCHVYVDKDADLDKAIPIIVNSKTQRPSVCNAAETLLVHQDVAKELFEKLLPQLKNVELRGDEKARQFSSSMKAATEEDWKTEYLDLIMAVRVVPSLDEAIKHINTYGTFHTEAIVSENEAAAEKFAKEIDCAAIMVNASTRFTDGGEFGFGAEIGISTQKLHARGPMGLAELTSYKYVVVGSGQVRA